MTGLADFLLARIADDEVAADLERWHQLPDYLQGRGEWEIRPWEASESFGLDIPDARIAAECEAKRRIVELHHRSGVSCPRCSLGDEDGEVVYEVDPCGTLKLLALPYGDHPDYRDEWRP